MESSNFVLFHDNVLYGLWSISVVASVCVCVILMGTNATAMCLSVVHWIKDP